MTRNRHCFSRTILLPFFTLFCLALSCCGKTNGPGFNSESAAPPPKPLYVVTDAGVTALTPNNGHVVWQFSFHGTIQFAPGVGIYPSNWQDPISGHAILVGKTLIVDGVEALYGLDAATGKQIWQTPLPDVEHGKLLATDKLVYVSANGLLFAFDVQTGALKWRWPNNGSSGVGPYIMGNNVLYVAFYSFGSPERLLALDPATGAPRWQTDVDPYANMGLQDIQLAKNAVVGINQQSDSVGLNPNGGNILWKKYLPGIELNYDAIVGNTLYTIPAEGDDTLIAYNPEKGQRLWGTQEQINQAVSQDGEPYVAFTQQGIFAIAGPTQGDLEELSPQDGHQFWKLPGTGTYSTISVDNGIIYVEDQQGTVTAFQASNQKQLWSKSFSGKDSMLTDRGLNRFLFVDHMPYTLLSGQNEDATSAKSQLVAVDPHTGQARWSAQLLGSIVVQLIN